MLFRISFIAVCFFIVSCGSGSRIGKISYGRYNTKVKQAEFNTLNSNDTVVVYIGVLHKRIYGNPNKDYTVYGCCYDSLYLKALKGISTMLDEKKIVIYKAYNLRRDELIEDFVNNVKAKKNSVLPLDFKNNSKRIMLLYLNYWEHSYYRSSGAGAGVVEGNSYDVVIIYPELVFIDKDKNIYYKNAYVNSLKGYFSKRETEIWNNVFRRLLH